MRQIPGKAAVGQFVCGRETRWGKWSPRPPRASAWHWWAGWRAGQAGTAVPSCANMCEWLQRSTTTRQAQHGRLKCQRHTHTRTSHTHAERRHTSLCSFCMSLFLSLSFVLFKFVFLYSRERTLMAERKIPRVHIEAVAQTCARFLY